MKHRNRTLIAAGFLCGVALPPAVAQDAGQQAEQSAQNLQSCERLSQLIDENENRFRSEWIDEANGVVRGAEARDCQRYVTQAEAAVEELESRQQAGAQQQTGSEEGQDESRIIVQQPEPRVTVEQDSPEVTYNQPQPRVQVQQGQPEIIVRQAEPTVRVEMQQPTISIDQPEPEIIVRMPEPDVSVSMPEPEIDVSQSQPEVNVQQPQPEVDLEMAQPDVNVRDQESAQVQVERGQPVVRRQGEGEQRAQVSIEESQPQVRYEAAQPNVEFEMTGEPQVSYNRSGEPEVRFEDQQQASAGQEGQQQGAEQRRQQAANTGEANQNEQQAAAGDDVDADETTASVGDQDTPQEAYQRLRGDGSDEAAGNPSQIAVSELIDRDVVNRRGEELGTVERVIETDGRTYVVLSHGGFLGMGEREVALPLDRISSVRGDDELLMRGMTDEDIEALPRINTSAGTELEDNQQVEISAS